MELGIGVMATQIPAYAGAKENKTYAIPFPYFYYKSEKLSVNRRSITGYFWQQGPWSIDANMGAKIAVKSDEVKIRQGMDDLAWIAELGPGLNYQLYQGKQAELRVTLPLRWAITTDLDSLSWVVNPSLRYNYNVAKTGLKFNFKAAVAMRSSQYHDYVYGIKDKFVTEQRTAYQGKSGYAGFTLSTGLTYRKDNLWLSLYSRYSNIKGASFDNSPLVQQNENWMIGLAGAWIIKQKIN